MSSVHLPCQILDEANSLVQAQAPGQSPEARPKAWCAVFFRYLEEAARLLNMHE